MQLKYISSTFLVLATAASASTVSVSAIIDYGFADSTGNELTIPSLMKIGYFRSISDSNLSSSTLVNLEADFEQFGSDTTTGTGNADSFPMHFDISISANISTDGSTTDFVNNKIYVWAFDGASTATSTSHGIIAFDDMFPGQLTNPNSIALSFEESKASEFETLVGSFKTDPPNFASTSSAISGGELLDFALITVPAPSSVTLLGLGSVALLLRRRR